MKEKFYICKHCGNLVGMIHNSGVPMICCGEPMTPLTPNTTDAAQEKHLPVIKVDGDLVTVTVSTVGHPMTEEHSIQWIYLETDCGGQRHALKPGDKPEATFALGGAKLVAAYAYCNLHGLWKTEL